MKNLSGDTDHLNIIISHLPYSEEDEKLGMLCTTVGSSSVQPGIVYPSYKNKYPPMARSVATGRVLPEFQIIYITEGEGAFSCNGIEYRILPGSIILVLPGLEHKYHPKIETGWKEYWVGFRGNYFSRLLEKGFFSSKNIFFQPGLCDSIMSLFNLIIDNAKSQRPLYQIKICSSILSLVAEIMNRDRCKEQAGYYERIITKAKYLMESNIYDTINLQCIYEQLGVSSTRLNEIFKIYTSMTPYNYFIQLKMHKAQSLLEEGFSVKETSSKIGFEDQYYFSRLFKNKTGISPSRWTKSLSATR